MSLFNTSQVYTSYVNIPRNMCPSSTEAMNKVKNMMQIHTTNGPVILPPYEQGVLKRDKYWRIKNYYIDWTYKKRVVLFYGRGWL